MTLAMDATTDDPLLPATADPTRCVTVNAGQSVPAAALADRELAEWVRSHGVSVTARDDRDLDLVRYHNIRPIQVVFRCGSVTADIRRAAAFDVSRFIVTSAPQLARLAEYVDSRRYLYLDDQAPLMLGDRRLKVIGLHTQVDDTGNVTAWAVAAQRLVARAAVLQACGSTVKRIVLSGGSTRLWLDPHAAVATSIVAAVDAAVRAESDRWRLSRPAVTLAALT